MNKHLEIKSFQEENEMLLLDSDLFLNHFEIETKLEKEITMNYYCFTNKFKEW
jgi:hypothetical protein